jgi:hypothetical protein
MKSVANLLESQWISTRAAAKPINPAQTARWKSIIATFNDGVQFLKRIPARVDLPQVH